MSVGFIFENLVSLFDILNNELTVFKAMKMISNQSLVQKWILHPPCFKPLPFVQLAGEKIKKQGTNLLAFKIKIHFKAKLFKKLIFK